MRSPVEWWGGPRVGLERAARTAAGAVLAWLLIRSLTGDGGGSAVRTGVDGLPSALVRWSTAAAPGRVHLLVDGAVSPAQRDWLAALDGAGARVTWEGRGVLPVAAVAEAVADPAGATRVLVAAPGGATVILQDRYGVLDSVRAGATGARFLANSAPAAVLVRAGALAARAVAPSSPRLGRLLLLGRVGWESKFVAAALEERGWVVDARLALAPRGDVVQGGASPLDTGRYAAVIALDTSAAAIAEAVVRYVRGGGGLVTTTAVATAPALAGLRAGRSGATLPAVEPFDTSALEPRRSLALTPVSPAPDAVPLERRDAWVAVAARRLERGRVAVIGYHDTWRWRLGGGGDAVEQHRAWWADLVASVAYAGPVPRASEAPVDEAPLVHLIERLGPASPPADAAASGGLGSAWLFALLGAALLAEWASRRLRGAP